MRMGRPPWADWCFQRAGPWCDGARANTRKAARRRASAVPRPFAACAQWRSGRVAPFRGPVRTPPLDEVGHSDRRHRSLLRALPLRGRSRGALLLHSDAPRLALLDGVVALAHHRRRQRPRPLEFLQLPLPLRQQPLLLRLQLSLLDAQPVAHVEPRHAKLVGRCAAANGRGGSVQRPRRR
eukprot:2669670-Prymnesium_polylepis.1